ncbi:probable protein GRIM REAPER at C-terminar half [Coccomyxa sp. Obi]|nr:probable protein GRIM REAPER at C-terminar half [Coccomyxa sp. Obi]
MRVGMARSITLLVVATSLLTLCQALHPDLAASASEAPSERRRRLKVEAILPTDPGQDGIAIGLDGHIYSDTAITDAVAQVGQLGPLNPKVAICHFPPQERAQFQVKYLEVIPLIAAQLIKKGDFLAPSYPDYRYGYGCVLYDHVCDFSTQEPCNLGGTCQTNNTCFCDNSRKTCKPRDQTNGCETDIASDTNNCGDCGVMCATGQTCCNGVCADLTTDPANCGACGFKCATIPGVQTATCSNSACTVTCVKPNPPVQACATNSGPFCANLQTDPNFCGSCNTTCPSDANARGSRSCTDGVCGITCDRNFPDQCGNPAQGVSLCVNLKSSVTNCGACGNVCPTDPAAITICNIGTCIFTCTGGTTQCGTPLNPFCADTTNDNLNCGSCGFVCQNGFSCVSSVCTNTNFGK